MVLLRIVVPVQGKGIIMILTAEQMNRLLAVVAEAPESTLPNEQRTHVRVGVRYKISMARLTDGATGMFESAWMRDISAGGLGLATSRELEAGTQVMVKLPGSANNTLKVVCEVRHCREVAPGIYHAGLKFVSSREEVEPRAAKPGKTPSPRVESGGNQRGDAVNDALLVGHCGIDGDGEGFGGEGLAVPVQAIEGRAAAVLVADPFSGGGSVEVQKSHDI
jgi:hypothetical protein